MVFGTIISSPRGNLSLQQVVDLAKIYLENARKTLDPKIALVLCHDTEVSLTHVKRAAKHTQDRAVREGIATIYIGLGELLDKLGHRNEAQAFHKKSEKWGYVSELYSCIFNRPPGDKFLTVLCHPL
jgi:hypothetical protein